MVESETSHHEERYPHRAYPNLCLLIFAALFVLLLVFAILASPSPFVALLLIFIAFLPTVLIFYLIRRTLSDTTVPSSFLYDQFLLGAFPVSIAVVLVETLIIFVIMLIIFQKDVRQFLSTFQNDPSTSPIHISPEQVIDFLKGTPIWKLLLYSSSIAFLVAAATEESAKWLLALRYRGVDHLPHNVYRTLRISANGIVAIAATGALGFATLENVMSVVKTSAQVSAIGFPTMTVVSAVIRDLLAIPLHVCTTTFVAINAARRRLFNDGHSIWAAFAVAVLVHGVFDAVPISVAMLILRESIPDWWSIPVVVAQFLMTLVFLLLCRARYKSLMERVRAVSSETEAIEGTRGSPV